MNRKYVFWQAKRWLGFFFVYLAIAVIVPLLFAAMSDPYDYTSGGYFEQGFSFYAIVVPTFMAAYMMAAVVFDYRYNRKSSDYFLSLPTDKRGMRATRILIPLVYQLVGYSVSFLFYFLVKGPASNMLFENIFWVYLMGLAFVVMNYFIALLPFSLARRPLEAIVNIVAVNVITGLFMTAVLTVTGGGFDLPYYTLSCPTPDSYDYQCIRVTTAFGELMYDSALSPTIWGSCLFSNQFARDMLGFTRNSILYSYYPVYMVIYVVYAVGAGLVAFLVPEVSGERMGNYPDGRSVSTFLFHAAYGILGMFLIYSYTSFVLIGLWVYFLLLFLYLVSYYGFLSLFNHRFKLTRDDLWGFIASAPFLLYGILTAVMAAQYPN